MTQNTEKYKELYSLAKEVYNSELDRFEKIDDKATKYLASLTFVIGVFGIFGKWVIDEFLPPSNFIAWLVIVVSLATLICFVSSWAFLFRVIRVHTVKILPLSDETISLFRKRNLATALYTMTKGLKDAHMTNRKTVDEKVVWLNRGYKGMICSVILLLILILTLSLHSLSPHKVKAKVENPEQITIQEKLQK